MIFYFVLGNSVLPVVISQFSFLILLIWFFSLFFLMSLANSLSTLFTFSKNHLLVLLIFVKVSFISFSFISALIYYFFPSTNFGILLFLVALSVWIGCLFGVTLVSWSRLVLLWTSLLALLFPNSIGFRCLCFHFHLFLCIFLFSFWFLP